MGWGNKAIEIRSVESGHLDGVFMHKKAQKLKFLCERNDKVGLFKVVLLLESIQRIHFFNIYVSFSHFSLLSSQEFFPERLFFFPLLLVQKLWRKKKRINKVDEVKKRGNGEIFTVITTWKGEYNFGKKCVGKEYQFLNNIHPC